MKYYQISEDDLQVILYFALILDYFAHTENNN